jgi:2'-5' RNA ligase
MDQRLGIALLPRADHLRLVIRLQREMRRAVAHPDGLRPALSVDGNLPHLTLLQGSFSDSVPLVPLSALQGIVRSVALPSPLLLDSTGVRCHEGGWVFVSLARTPLLDAAQDAAVSACGTATIGSRYLCGAYEPHITLARAADQPTARQLAKAVGECVPLPRAWAFDRLSVYLVGESGAHSTTLASVPLPGA